MGAIYGRQKLINFLSDEVEEIFYVGRLKIVESVIVIATDVYRASDRLHVALLINQPLINVGLVSSTVDVKGEVLEPSGLIKADST